MNIFDLWMKQKIPKEVYGFKKTIMHLTDTPDIIFPYIKRLIKLIEPDIIIHTGDLVDNIKLELSRQEIGIYEKRVEKLLTILRSRQPDQILISIGNHDDETIINKYLQLNEFLFDKTLITIEKKNYCFAHKHMMFSGEKADYFLYGHSPSVPTDKSGDSCVLNGLSAIHIIDTSSGKVIDIPYPKDTDYFRQKKFKLGF
ncbi:MAG: metallophosphoesterase [Clostridiales bacterium]|nr:metallophosphoesterase [Clostridiales bacterium]